MSECWRPISGFEGWYEVSDQGRVRSVARTVRCIDGRVREYRSRILKLSRDRYGYANVRMMRAGAMATSGVHVLVADAFIGPRPSGMDICHNDGNKENNAPNNLRYDTRAANHADKKRHGTMLSGERNPQAKLTEQAVAAIRSQRGQMTGVALAKQHGVSCAHISRIQLGKKWAA